MKKILPAALLALMLTGGAFSQTRTFFTDLKLSGIQSENCVAGNTVCHPNIFVLRGSRETFTVELTMAVDSTRADEKQGGNNAAAGKWSMIVFKAGKYIGTLFGDTVSGRVRWTKDLLTGIRTGRATTAGLRILGGTDGYAQVEANDTPSLMFSSFTNATLPYTEARLTSDENKEIQ
jgi:hypothetical protein